MPSKPSSDISKTDFPFFEEIDMDNPEVLRAVPCLAGEDYTSSSRVPHPTPDIIISRDGDQEPRKITKQQRKRTRRKKNRCKIKQQEEDHSRIAPPRSAHSDTELPVLVSRTSWDNTQHGKNDKDTERDKPGSSLSLPPMPCRAPVTRPPPSLAPLHNAPPPSFSYQSPRKMERSKEPVHPFLKRMDFEYNDFKLKNAEFGLRMYASAKERNGGQSSDEDGEKQERHLSDGLRINFPALVGVSSSTSLLK